MFTLITPKNQAGIDSYNKGIDDYENSELYNLSDAEYEQLRKHHVFDILNERFDLWIDEGESESISVDQLREAYDAITPAKGEWTKAVDASIRYGTCLFVVF